MGICKEECHHLGMAIYYTFCFNILMICYQIYPHDCNHYMRTRYSEGAAPALPAVEPRLETTECGVKCETIAPIISHPPSPPNTVLPHLSPHSSDCLSSLTPTNTPIYYIKMVSSPCGLILYLQTYPGVILLKEYQFFPKKDQNQTTF